MFPISEDSGFYRVYLGQHADRVVEEYEASKGKELSKEGSIQTWARSFGEK